ncbi:MAG: J domain-containing protein [Chloroherpetonaceae bacterium]|nr:J domain-containing protein [Chloroherpetonaceae bacterium]MCS7212277.1 J domain-containing protein [Chloroherpetonaceae bacterium]MDW8020266.1 J domain-containing protein [Chloroherpetonaceae bacterium]MDW8466546.1 J domain-containing protein [Chloroherpetonaceae bacterium]
MPASHGAFKNYYEVLRVRPYDPPELIQAAYMAQIKQWHPDRFQNADAYMQAQAHERTKLILEAKRVLLDPVRKAEYDAEFAARFPKRFEKLSTRARVKQRQVTVEDLMAGYGFPINEKAAAAKAVPPSNLYEFKWLSFSTRVNPRLQRVIFNVNHFLDNNPDCEVRFKFHYNMDWTEFSRQRIYPIAYRSNVALVEMQARRPSSKGRWIYSPIICKTVVVTNYDAAMQERELIFRHLRKVRNRMALKLVIVLLGSAIAALTLPILTA